MQIRSFRGSGEPVWVIALLIVRINDWDPIRAEH
jgi:hypothetical protein